MNYLLIGGGPGDEPKTEKIETGLDVSKTTEDMEKLNYLIENDEDLDTIPQMLNKVKNSPIMLTYIKETKKEITKLPYKEVKDLIKKCFVLETGEPVPTEENLISYYKGLVSNKEDLFNGVLVTEEDIKEAFKRSEYPYHISDISEIKKYMEFRYLDILEYIDNENGDIVLDNGARIKKLDPQDSGDGYKYIDGLYKIGKFDELGFNTEDGVIISEYGASTGKFKNGKLLEGSVKVKSYNEKEHFKFEVNNGIISSVTAFIEGVRISEVEYRDHKSSGAGDVFDIFSKDIQGGEKKLKDLGIV